LANGSYIKELRKAKAWSQAHLARAAGVSVRTIQRLEQSGQCADETWLSVASALDVDVERLMLPARVEARSLAPASETTVRPLFRSMKIEKILTWSSLLMAPALLFVASNVLKFELDLPFLYDVLAYLGAATGLDSLAGVLLSPVVLLGGPAAAGLLALSEQVQVEGEEDEEGFTVSRIRFSFNRTGMIVLLVALASLGALVGYAAVENLAHWIREIVNAG
jgi:DNA-binding XRE family transcriptional regulator